SYERAVSGIGRTQGLTATQLQALTAAAAEQGEVSLKSAQEQATAYLATGRIGQEEISRLIAIGKDYASFMGVDAAEATKQLAKAMLDPE
ncbi:phage tail length tape measure family protein, partial [Escherichia coli]|uniref:phage tail length tape measure family protein n=1 Tax=Escherichia coli TaxID=562 RepID=UPI001ADD80DB